MKTQLIGILLATAFSTTAFAGNNLSSFKFPTPDSATGAGFESWAKDVLRYLKHTINYKLRLSKVGEKKS